MMKYEFQIPKYNEKVYGKLTKMSLESPVSNLDQDFLFFKDTHLFSPAANFFNRTKKESGEAVYTTTIPGTHSWKKFWATEYDRCINGYEVNGVKITGKHYFYLNYCPIERVINEESGETRMDFPRFLSMDYYWFWELEKCENPEKAIDRQHIILSKARRKGFSYKNASDCVHIFFMFPDSNIIIVSQNIDKANNTFNMALAMIDFINEHTEFRTPLLKRTQSKSGSVVHSGYKVKSDGKEYVKGRNTKIITASLFNKPDAAAGYSAKRVIYEEVGMIDNFIESWEFTEPTLRSGSIKKGICIAFGTGGDTDGSSRDFKTVFYNPEIYGFKGYKNIYEYEDRPNEKCGLFFPHMWLDEGTELKIEDKIYKALDKDGNANFWVSDLKMNIERQNKKNDKNAYEKALTQFCKTPSEAFLVTKGNVFPVGEISQRLNTLNRLSATNKLYSKGELVLANGSVKFKPDYDDNLYAIDYFPLKTKETSEQLKGAFIQYEPPRMISGKVPEGAYIIGCDTFRVEGGVANVTANTSLGSIYVMRTDKYMKELGDCNTIVANYIGRTMRIDEFNFMLMKIAIYYNAKIMYENEVDNVRPYFQQKKSLHMLCPPPGYVVEKVLPNSNTLNRRFGFSMANRRLKSQAIQYLIDWLLDTRIEDSNIRNLDVIKDKGILEEMIRFDFDNGNFDRISSFIGCILYTENERTTPVIKRTSDFSILTKNDKLFNLKNDKLRKNERVIPSLSYDKKYANDAQWGKDFLDYLVPLSTSTREYREFNIEAESNYKLFNNEIDQKDYDHWCKPLGIDVGQYEEEILPYNKVYQKINVLLGEQLQRGDVHRPVLLSEKDIKEKTFEMRNALIDYIKSEMDVTVMKHLGMLDEESEEDPYTQLGVNDFMKPEEIMSSEFLSQKEIFCGKVLDYAKYDQDITFKSNEGFKHGLISGMEVVWIGMDKGKPTIKVVNPLTFFHHKNNEEMLIQDGDYAGHRYFDTRYNILKDYGHKMNKKDRIKFSSTRSKYPGSRINKEGDLGLKDSLEFNIVKELSNFNRLDSIGNSYTDSDYRADDMVEVVHVEWKTLRKVYILTYIDDFGEEIVDIVDDSLEIPKIAATVDLINQFGDKTTRKEWIDPISGRQYYAEELWIPRVWEGTRIDEDIYIDIREKPNQPLSVTDPYGKCKLGYCGIYFDNVNARPVSMMSRMRPFQMLYFIAMHQLSKLLSRNIGKVSNIDWSQIPEFNDEYGRKDVELFWFYLNKGYAIFDSMKNTQGYGSVSHRKSGVEPADMSTTVDMINLTHLCLWLDQQIGEAAGISKPREGQVSANTNVTDNQQSIVQSSHITEVYFHKHNLLWKDILTMYVDLFIDWAKRWFEENPRRKEHMLQYVAQDETIQMLKVTPDLLDNADFGIFLGISSANEAYINKIEQLLLPLIQNEMQGAEMVSMVLKSRAQGTSPEEVHKLIKELTAKKTKEAEDREARSIEQQEKLNQQRQEIQNAQLQQIQDLEKEKIYLKEELDRLKQLEMIYAKADAELQVNNDEDKRELERQKEILMNKEKEIDQNIKTVNKNN